MRGQPRSVGRQRGLSKLKQPRAKLGPAHLEGCPPSQALVYNGANAPQVRLPIVVLGHDDFRGLWGVRERDGLAMC